MTVWQIISVVLAAFMVLPHPIKLAWAFRTKQSYVIPWLVWLIMIAVSLNLVISFVGIK